MRGIQWHLKRHWHILESLEKVIPLPHSLHPHLDWWLNKSNVLWCQPLHPLQHALQMFTDASNKGWGAHLGDSTARGVWSYTESRLHINFLELKAVFLTLKSFEHLCRDQIVLIATDNTTVVSYINKEGGMGSGSLCALLWRLLSWCHPRGIVLRARHIPGRLNVIADKTQSGDSDKVLPFSAGIQSLVFKMGPATCRPVCNLVQSQAFQVCFTGTGSHSLGSRCPESVMGEFEHLCLPSSLPAQPSNLQGDGSRLSQDDCDCSRVAQHALVLGPDQPISSDSIQASSAKGSGHSAIPTVCYTGTSLI